MFLSEWSEFPSAPCLALQGKNGADKFLARPGRKQARKHVRDARDFNNIETRAFIQGKAPKEINAILTETLACFLPGRAKDLSAPLVKLFLWLTMAFGSSVPPFRI